MPQLGLRWQPQPASVPSSRLAPLACSAAVHAVALAAALVAVSQVSEIEFNLM